MFVFTYGLISGRGEAIAPILMTTGEEAVKLTMMLLSSMTLWGGVLGILEESGDVKRLGGMVRRVMAPLSSGLKDAACWEAMGTNLAANMLGMGNAATPAGIRAANLLANHGEAGLKALAALLVINNAGLQLLPTTVITMRQAAGSASPGEIWLPSLAASCASVVVGLAVLRLLQARAERSRK